MLKQIRNIPFVNKLVRTWIQFNRRLFHKLSLRWPTSGIVEIPFRDKPIFFRTHTDDGIVDALYYDRDYIEYRELVLFSYLAEKSETIIDVGANTGLYSIVGSLFNPTATIVAFEPYASNTARLKENISLNNARGIEIVEKVVGDKTGQVSFTVPGSGIVCDTTSVLGDFSRTMYEGEINWIEISVAQTTLSDYFQTYSGKIHLLKVDVEGYEMNVFEGADEFFSNHQPIILCEIFLDDERKLFFEEFITRHQYHAYMVLKGGLLRLDEGLTTNYDGLNFLFARNKTSRLYTSFQEIQTIVNELLAQEN